MSQKSITSFFLKSPVPHRIMKRNISEAENIDSSNVLQDDKKVKLDNSPPQLIEANPTNDQVENPSVNESEIVKDKSSMQQQIEMNKLNAELKLASKSYPALHNNIGLTWFKALKNEFGKPYFKKVSRPRLGHGIS